MNIVIAEDEYLITLTLKAQLEAMGHTVVGTSTGGDAAVTLAKQLRPDLILMDIGMPGMDGITATARIMSEAPVAIVILTAYNDRARVDGALRAGAAAYLLKPISDTQLKRAIDAAVERFGEAHGQSPTP